MSKALVAIVGPSGSGKSTSLRNLPPDTTAILDLERKGFPFRNYDTFTKVFPCNNVAEFDTALTKVLSDKAVTHIVIESFTKYVELLLKLSQQINKGYDVYTWYNKAIGNMLDKVKNDHAVVIMTAIDEIVKIPEADGSESAQRRMAVKGKEWEGKIEKEFLMVLFTTPRKNKEGRMEYMFQTNTDGVTSAKTPMEMFPDQLVPNDLMAVLTRAKEYFVGTKSQPTS